MTAPLPTRKDEAFRYADIKALGEVWDDLAAPDEIEIAAHKKVQQIWMPADDAIDDASLSSSGTDDSSSLRFFGTSSGPSTTSFNT